MAGVLLSSSLLLFACGGKPAGPVHTGPAPEHYCPGQSGCEKGYTDTDPVTVGVAKVSIAPTGFETALPAYLDRTAAAGQCDIGDHCGELAKIAFRDCGTDMLCKGDPGYPGPDADGTEGDGVWDFFRDCGSDGLCPGDAGYPGPDADGTEGNGIFDGLWLAGFGNNRPAEGVHDEIDARAVVIGRGDVKVAIAYVDLVGFFHGYVEKVREAVKQKRPDVYAGLDTLFVGATHVHEAPDSMGQWGLSPDGVPGVGLPSGYSKSGVNGPWMDQVIGHVADAIIAAYDAAKPATLKMATGRTGAKGLIHDSRDPVIIDDSLTVIEADDAQTGKTITDLISWGNHPETVGSTNNLITADYVGYLRRAVEDGLPAAGSNPALAGRGGIAVFLQAEVGGLLTPLHTDVVARDGTPEPKETWDRPKAIGENVGAQVLTLLKTAKVAKGPGVAFRTQTLYLPVDNKQFQYAFELGLFDRRVYNADGSHFTGTISLGGGYVKSEMMVLQVGPASFLSVPGELFSELAVGFGDQWTPADLTRIDPANPNPPDLSKAPTTWYKEQLPGTYKIILGLGDDELGYLVPPYDFKLDTNHPYFDEAPGDHYEETNSLGPKTVPDMEKTLKLLVDWTQST